MEADLIAAGRAGVLIGMMWLHQVGCGDTANGSKLVRAAQAAADIIRRCRCPHRQLTPLR
ncbi:hypothetical protein DXN05_21265 [Deminuibacter soli]|uniref:Uncharacterized protein n=1 Tax=Deminuibacter soli TaxID=2291815 RepID=A0A3E1NE35_9BACT|nr:hypothetical protein DXN05_21265 [Deminuibacter soli]